MSRSKFEQVEDGKWYKLDTPWSHACCDCGLVHRVETRLRNGEIQIRFDRQPQATGGVRSGIAKSFKS